MSNLHITNAYCIELEEVVTITRARKEFLVMAPRPEKFHFLCSDPICRKQGVRVIGVNYRENAQESVIHKTPHFREQDSHLQGCEWERPPETEDSNGLLQGETEESARKRRARRKLTDFIDIFYPNENDECSPNEAKSPPIEGSIGSTTEQKERPRKEQGPYLPGLTKTSDLERLVESFREAKEKLSTEEFAVLEIEIKGIGKMKLTHYFQRLIYAKTSTTQRIIFGGATLVNRYGKDKRHAQGFLLRFYDKVEGKLVSLYVSQVTMKEYRHRKYIDDILSKANKVRYFTIYALGHFEPAENERHGLNLVVSDLRHLVIVLGPAKTEDSPEGKDVSNDSNTLSTK